MWSTPIDREETQMGRVVVNNSLTLDGVMQAPGRLDEDRRGGFEHGGWAQPYFDEVMGSMAAEGITKGGAFLLGRRGRGSGRAHGAVG
jgi:hypothetical protein